MTTDDYAFAQSEFYTYRRTLADYAARLAEAATLLRERTDQVTIAHVGLDHALRSASDVIDGHALPAAADIQRMLVRYRGAYDRLHATWDGLPAAERKGLRPPPSGLPALRTDAV